jgi:hypothetical protein
MDDSPTAGAVRAIDFQVVDQPFTTTLKPVQQTGIGPET